MQATRSLSLITCALLLGAASSLRALAGPITPPPGPVAPTPGPDARIPISSAHTPGTTYILFRITSPGSYRLTSNILVPSGKVGIEIAASDVTLDLVGFTIRGSGPDTEAIRTPEGLLLSGIRLRNGIVAEAGRAVHLDADDCDVRDISVRLATAGAGIFIRSGSVTDCQVSASASAGIEIEGRGAVRDCIVKEGSSDGIRVGDASVIESCVAEGNSGAGIRAADAARIVGCVVSSNNSGGIVTGSGSSVESCVSAASGTDGVSVGRSSTVTGCDVRGSSLAGIAASHDAIIRSNLLYANGLGIHVTGSGCRVEDNSCIGGDKGMVVAGAGNTISRNVCSRNTILNWEIAGGNKCVVVVGINAAPISGDAGGTGPGSTHPLANYTN